MKNILVLNGSPHRRGNTAALLKAALRGAKGARAQVIDAYALSVAPILKNDYTGKQTRPRDGMSAVVKAVQSADTLILATPIYYWGMSAQLKLVWERLHDADAEALFKGKTFALVATGGGDDAHDAGADLIEMQFKNVCDFLGMTFKGMLFASSATPVAKQTKTLARAERFLQ